MDENHKPCIVCGSESNQGITIWKSFLCNPCEQEMVQTDVFDERYSFFIERMRDIWKLEA